MTDTANNNPLPPTTNNIVAPQPSIRKLFWVLFEDTGTEKDSIISENASNFYQFAQENFLALETCEAESLQDEIPVLQSSGVKALAVFELPDNIDLTELQKLALSQWLSESLMKASEPENKSLTATAG